MTSLRRAVPALAVLLVLLCAPSARAAFPGHNGLLVVEPRHGGGLLLDTVQGGVVQRICTDPALCGTPTAPEFSPGGDTIVFATGTQPAVVAVDGTCLWCRLGAPLAAQTGTTPAFTADGRAISYATAAGLARTTLAGVTTTVTPATESGAVWSSRGARAFVRAGAVLFVPAGSAVARRLAKGSQPDFAPDGRSVDYVRAGWIWTVGIGGGASQRLVRGTHPAFSPDGRRLAFVAPSGRIETAGARGRHPHPVPGLWGRAVAWQPVPRIRRAPCAVPTGATLLAASAEATVTRAPGAAAAVGCLTATGRRTPLLVATPPATTTGSTVPTATVLAGRFAVLATVTDTGLPTCHEALTRFDLASGRAKTLYARSCGIRAGAVDEVGLDSSGFAAWHATEQTAVGQPLLDLTCPQAGLCVGVDAHGNAATASDPTAPATAWAIAKVAPALAGVGCHAADLCVGLSGGTVTVTNDPGDGPGRWSVPASVDGVALNGVACPSASLCVAVDNAGNVVTSTAPSAAASVWQTADVAGADPLDGISCPSARLCVAVGANGDVVTSTDPAGGPSAWSRSTAEPGGATLTGVACPTETLCVATDSAGHLLSTQTPTAGTPWAVVTVPGAPLERPACPSVSLCLATDPAGAVFAERDPGTAAESVSTQTIASSLGRVACVPGTATCAVPDGSGNLLSTTDAASGTAPWAAAGVDDPPCGMCLAEQIYVADSDGIQALDTRLPGPGGALTALALSGNARTVTWLDAGAPHVVGLR